MVDRAALQPLLTRVYVKKEQSAMRFAHIFDGGTGYCRLETLGTCVRFCVLSLCCLSSDD